ncbi:hypothetical protein LP419_06495 [Massilia sp. H-1]|nr:hypothetical protein LP419_06495 [Massilia sp. H-1]
MTTNDTPFHAAGSPGRPKHTGRPFGTAHAGRDPGGRGPPRPGRDQADPGAPARSQPVLRPGRDQPRPAHSRPTSSWHWPASSIRLTCCKTTAP